MKQSTNVLLILSIGMLIAGAACSNLGALGDMVPGADTDEELSESTVVAGLKEALRVGTERTVDQTSVIDGYLANALIRIATPEELEPAARTLRQMGLGGQVDDFEKAMNRAAERAAGEARDVFWQAVTTMTITDAFAILNGDDTAATRYFRGRTEAELTARFKPIVTGKMSEVGLYTLYNQFTDVVEAIPFTTVPTVDLDAYVTQKALDGLFVVLAEEETRIRRDPVARTTDLLRRVFGR